MSDFLKNQKKISALKKKIVDLEKKVQNDKQKSILLKSKMERTRRNEGLTNLPSNHSFVNENKKLITLVKANEEKLVSWKDDLMDLQGKFESFFSPQKAITHLDDALPFLLLPVRVQTRFMQIKHYTTKLKTEFVRDIKSFDLSNLSTLKPSMNPLISDLMMDETKDLIRDLSISTIDTTTTTTTPLTIGTIPGIGRRFLDQPITTPGRRTTETEKKVFKRVPDSKEIWIRIFPDDIFIHSHEEGITEDELKAAVSYWEEVFNADIAYENRTSDNEDQAKADWENSKLGAWTVLVNSFGAYRASWVLKTVKPDNLLSENAFNVQLKAKPSIDTSTLTMKADSWSEAPKTYVLPDRFVVRLQQGKITREVVGNRIPENLILSLDPNQTNDGAFENKNGTLQIPDYMSWMTDFDAAERVGMAIKIPLERAEDRIGFDKVVVLGIKASSNVEQTTELVEKLFDNHHYKPGGMGILPQGTPTNNTGSNDAKSNKTEDDPTRSQQIELGDPLFSPINDHYKKRDGQRLAEALGLDVGLFQHIELGNHSDISEAIAMNLALWPATGEYYLNQFIKPAITNVDIKNTRTFFKNYVTGRGLLPSLRIDEQPYGVLVSSAWSKWKEKEGQDRESKFVHNLHKNVIQPMDLVWSRSLRDIKHIQDPSIPTNQFSEQFLAALGLHASSVEYYQRSLLGPYLVWNLIQMMQISNTGVTSDLLSSFNLSGKVIEELEKVGFNFNKVPFLFETMFLNETRLLNGAVIDNLSLSETRGLQNVKGYNANYINLLINSDIDQIKKEAFEGKLPLANAQTPNALLYLMLRHALLREYLDTSFHILKDKNLVADIVNRDFEFDSLRADNQLSKEHELFLNEMVRSDLLPEFEMEIHRRVDRIQPTAEPAIREELFGRFRRRIDPIIRREVATEVSRITLGHTVEKSKWAYLENKYSLATGNLTMFDYIKDRIRKKTPDSLNVRQLKDSLKTLSSLPTARLERLFAEHIDLCSYRMDSWMQGLANRRLLLNRKKPESKKGIHLGAFGYLEKVKPSGDWGIATREITKPEMIPLKDDVSTDEVIIPVFDSTLFTGTGVDIKRYTRHAFIYLGNDYSIPLIKDPITKKITTPPKTSKDNLGYIHTPSAAHAATAAVLRSGYQTHKTINSPNDTLAVSLTSKRVRTAIYYLQGISNGQELSALLGYQFERGLHDNFTLNMNLDQFILDIRIAYPLRSDKLTETNHDGPIDTVEAFNVVDGIELLEAFRQSSPSWYSKIDSLKGNATSTRNARKAIEKEIRKLDEALDSITDLLLAESVYQIVKGNPERANSAMNVLSGKGEVHMPEIIEIARHGRSITHRKGILLPTVGKDKIWSTSASPRSLLQPKVNSWVEAQLPAPSKMCVRIGLPDNSFIKVKISELNIEPIDFIHYFNQSLENFEEHALSAVIRSYVFANNNALKETDKLTIDYKDRNFGATEFCLYEIYPLAKRLLEMLSSRRHLNPEDFLSPTNANELDLGTFYNNTHFKNKLNTIINGSGTLAIGKLISNLEAKLLALPSLNEGDLVTASQQNKYNQLYDLLISAGRFGLFRAVPHFSRAFTISTRAEISTRTEQIISELTKRKTSLVNLYSALSSSEGKDVEFRSLQEITTLLFGKEYKLFAQFNLTHPAEFTTAFNYPDLLKHSGPFAIDHWIQGLSKVRPAINRYHHLSMLREAVDADAAFQIPKVVQLPFDASQETHWVGMDYPKDYDWDGDVLSLVLEYPEDYEINQLHGGFIVDEWTEVIPEKTHDSNIALHFNQPNAEPPQAILLAVTPDETGTWNWDDLCQTIIDTVEMAKKRAVEPEHIQKTGLAQLLPAVIAAIDESGNAPSLDFGRNIVPVRAGFMGLVLLDAVTLNN